MPHAELLHRLALLIPSRVDRFIRTRHGLLYDAVFTASLMALALALRLAIAPISAGLQYVTFFPAVTIAAIVCGYRSGLFATLIGLVFATYIFTPPYFSISLEVLQTSLWSNMVFLVDGLVISFAIEAMHRFRDQAERELQAARESARQVQELNLQLNANIAELKKMEEQIRHLAFYDSLTNLPNRRMLLDRVKLAMAASKRSKQYCAVLFLDLDNFKPLNDSQGHAVGDLLLIEAADRLRKCVRETDTVARFGGDEFVVLLNDLGANKAGATVQMRIVAEKIAACLSSPYRFEIGQEAQKLPLEHHCTASIGAYLFTGDSDTVDDILSFADSAMYRAKESGRNAIRYCNCDTEA